jgi:hypothetical protein
MSELTIYQSHDCDRPVPAIDQELSQVNARGRPVCGYRDYVISTIDGASGMRCAVSSLGDNAGGLTCND